MKKINLQISTGYEILEKKQTIKIRKAFDLLLSEKCFEFSKAINNYDGTATLISSIVKCPYCGSELPVKYVSNKETNREKITQWASGQLTLFEHNIADLTIGKKFFVDEKIHCPYCKNVSKKSERYYDVSIAKERGKIIVSCTFDSIDELLSIKWPERIELKSPFIYYETTVFNLHSGHTYIQITNCEGEVVCVRDVTEIPDFERNGILYNLLLSNQKLRKKLKESFKDNNGFPFHSQMITFENLVSATRFVGYNRNFYNSIPLRIETYELSPGFKAVAKALHLSKNVPVVYERLNLPANKATRRIIFSNPGLMFYYREIKQLYNAVNNIDYFNRILLFEHIYFILSKMSCYPVIAKFISEAFKYESSTVVMNQMAKHFYSLCLYSFKYMSMSDAAKKTERNQKKWLNLCRENSYTIEAEAIPSTIRCMPCTQISDCLIDGYSFERLVTTNDYKMAGKMMNNCLSSYYFPVIAVKANGVFVAAFSVSSNWEKISEAFLRNNQPITNNFGVCAAIRRWCKRYDVKWDDNE